MEQRTDEWFAARRGRITASAAGAILGNSPFADRDDVMRRMVREWHGAESEFTGNVATEYGTYHEAGALVEYQMETGNEVEHVGFLTRDEWAGCSPDGLVGLVGGLEIKCPFSKRRWKDDAFKTLADQPHYYDQVQFSMWVTTRAWWDFFQWAPGHTALEKITPDSAWRSKNLPKLLAFYQDYLHEREHNAQPHLEAKRAVVDTLDAARMVAEWDDLNEAIDRATDRKKDLLEQMIKAAGGRDALFAGRKLTKVERAGSVSYAKALRVLAPDADLEPYRGKPSASWRLT